MTDTVTVTYARDAGGYTFTEAELNELDLILQNLREAVRTNESGKGLGVAAYEAVLRMISDEEVIPQQTPEFPGPPIVQLVAKAGVDQGVWAWVNGARKVNDADGFFAVFIHEYTIKQLELRGLAGADAAQITQKASNQIAIRLLADIVGTKNLPGPEAIGAIDAGVAASTAFRHDGFDEYAPWAGTLLFPYLGVSKFFQNLLLEDKQVIASIPPIGELQGATQLNIKYAKGTYDLVASLQAAEIAASKSGLASTGNFLQALSAWMFGPPQYGPERVPYPNQQALVDATTKWFNDTYKLESGTFKVGDDLVLKGNALDKYDYFVGTYKDDDGEGRKKLIAQGASGDALEQVIMNGGGGNDVIVGWMYDDLLDGDEGDDELDGGKGSDRLYGGSGADLYLVGEGHDILRDDEEGRGQVKTKDGYTFGGGVKKKGSSYWESGDGSVRYYAVKGSLLIIKDKDQVNRVTIKDFDFALAAEDGYLGITLRNEEDEEDEEETSISTGVQTAFKRALGWVWPSDPLVMDLDGDGVEIIQSDTATLFDHNADHVKTGTQWVGADDGILVRDLNANGAIDNGRELFGDQTLLPNGNLATNGYAALAALDSNADGVIDANDAAYEELRVWRDQNQDGISQAEELQSLAGLGISSINLTANAQGQSTYTRTVTAEDGSTSSVTHVTQNVNFQNNNFYREFTDDPEVTSSAAALPQLVGSGLVRNLREAMSLGTAQAAALEQSVSSFKAASSTQDRQNLLDAVTSAWSSTSNQADARARNPVRSNNWYSATVGDAMAAYAQAKPAEYAMMSALERFNGQAVLERYVRQRSASYYDPSEQRWKGYTYYTVEIEAPRLAIFAQAYQALKDSIYENLYRQTASQALLNLIEIKEDSNGVRLDFTAVDAAFSAQAAQDPAIAAVNLAEFLHFAKSNLHENDWDGAVRLAELLEAVSFSAAQSAILGRFNYQFSGAIGDAGAANLQGAYGDDVLVGRAGDDTLSGNSGDDILIGGQGNDKLYGGYGNDQLVGGQGDDYLSGQWGTDTYFWGAGQGNDTIADSMVNAGEQNAVILRGLNPADVSVELVTPENFTRFRLTILSTGETLTLDTNGWDYWGRSYAAPIRLVFADGNQWSFEEIIRQTLSLPTDGDDFLLGSPVDDLPDRLNGGAGNDIIVGRGGADVMEGGTGDDMLYGHAVLSTFRDGEVVPPYWRFDQAVVGDSDVYVFGRGDGRDTILDYSYRDSEDVLRFKAGVAAEDLELAQRGRDLVVKIIGTSDQVTIKNFFSAESYSYSYVPSFYEIERFDFANGMQWDLSTIKNAGWAGTAQDDEFMGDAGDNTIGGAAGNDLLDGGSGDDQLSGGEGNDTLRGSSGDDILLGGAGDDVLQGGDGDDVLDGGAGNDQLQAGYGADVIRFGRGDGQDVLARDVVWLNYYSATTSQAFNPGSNNVVELKAGVNPADVKLVRNGSTLTIQIKGTDDALTIKDAYVVRSVWDEPTALNFSLREIRFEDGTVWGPAEMLAQSLIGDEANETFIGFSGNDVFDGGGGNDRYDGQGGFDTYRFGRGDGVDKVSNSASTVVFKDGVSPSDVIARRVGNSLELAIKGTQDRIVVDYVFVPWNPQVLSIQKVMFADGTVWLPEQITLEVVKGTDGNDVIADIYSNDHVVMAGGTGNDILAGERSETIYVFNRGDGQDVLDETGSYSGNDILRFGPGIVATDLEVSEQGEDLVIRIAGTNDQVTIKRHAYYRIENIEVGGITLDYEQLLELIPDLGEEDIYGSAGDDVLVGTDKNSFIVGFDGNDNLSGGGGEDVLDGGAGDDVLAGGAGRDKLDGGLGSNTYVYQRGDGLDTIKLTPGASDVIELGAGIAQADVSVQIGSASIWDGGTYMSVRQLVIGFGGNDTLVLQIPDSSDFTEALQAAALRFADGTTLSYEALQALVDDGTVGYNSQYGDDLALIGSQADDDLSLNDGSRGYLEGRDNNDYLQSDNAQVLLDGGDGEDELSAYGGGAVMAGGRGADVIDVDTRGEINTIVFNRGDGQDWVIAGGEPGVLSLGADIDVASVRMRVDARGYLLIQFEGSDGDEISTPWYQNDLESPHFERGFDKIQFIDADGKTRLFDLTRLEGSAAETAFMLPGAEQGIALLVQFPELEVLEPSPVYGGEAAIAYAQTGSLRGDAYIAANADLAGDNLLFGTVDGETLDGGDGNDVITADDGDDVLLGGSGDDVLIGGWGNDVLDAGTGHNKAYGGEGNDTYLYSRGNGFLYIDDGITFDGGEGSQGNGNDYNHIVFGEGITFEDLLIERDSDNLKVTVAGAAGDTLVLAGYNEQLENRNRSVDEFVFQDGSSVILDELWGTGSESYLMQRGDGDLTGTNFQDHLLGGLGDDRLNGAYGNDRLEGGAGNDAYVLQYGSGNDVIVDTAADDNVIVVADGSVTAAHVSLHFGDEVMIQVGSRLITLEGWDGRDLAQAPISRLVFQNGSTLSMADLFNRPRTFFGTSQADVLTGGMDSDVLWGLQGDDLMQGGAGSDTYVIEENSGADTITDLSTPGQENTILFLDGVESWDIRLTLDAEQNLVLRWADGMQVTLTDFDYQDPNSKTSIAFFQFGDGGPIMSYEELLWKGFEIEGTDQNDLIHTTALSDEVYGGDGDDVILGSTGSDDLHGGSGNDVYEYRLGDGWVGINDVADASGANVVRFGEDITPEMLERKLRFNYYADEPEANNLRIVFDENNVLQLNGFDPQNPEGSPHAVEYFEFADGTVLSWDQLLDKIFVVEGYSGEAFDEELSGTSRSDRLYGYDGNDTLTAHGGDDVLTGGTGADLLQGGAGADNYVFQLGDGVDTIEEDGVGGNTITFGEGVFEADITVERDGVDFVIRYGNLGDTIRIASVDGVNTPTQVIDHFELADGTLIPFAQYVNHAPEIGDLLQDQQGRVGDALSFEFSGGAFFDQDGSELSYRAQLVNGSPLPDWLVFNPQTRSFSGTPPLDAMGSYEVAVFAVDPSGAAMQQQFRIEVDSRPNQAPEAQTDEAGVQEDVLLSTSGNVLANDSDPDATGILTVANAGIYQGLWGELELQADGSYIYRLNNDHPEIQAMGQGHSQTEVFSYTVSDGIDVTTAQLIVTIAGSNDAPVLSAEAATVQEDVLTEATGSVLAAATDADGDTLLVVDAGVYEGQYGTLTIGADGSYRYVLRNASSEVQALQAGQVVHEAFTYSVTDGFAPEIGYLGLSIVGTNDGPQVFADTATIQEDADPVQGNVLDNDQDADEDTALQVGNAGVLQGQYGTLTLNLDGSYSYALYDDASVQALAAGQGVVDVFSYVASDGQDNATTTLTVTVTGENDAPVIVSQVGAQTGQEGQVFNYLLPESLFLDVDQGDTLAFAISRADGQALPAWLSFNPVTRMLSGTPGENDAGVYQLRVTATDQAGASVSSLFSLTVDDSGVCTGGAVFEGTSRADTINGTECADVINGHAGNDQLYGQGGNDVLNGGLGADLVSGGAGNDNLQMSVDALWGLTGIARNQGSPGSAGSNVRVSLMGMNRTLDVLDGGSGWDVLTATAGSDAVLLDQAGSNHPLLRDIEQFDLGAGNDVLDLTSTRFSYGAVVANGGSGNDVLWSGGGNDRLYGGAGSDVVDAGAGDDFVDGGDQDDRLVSLLGYGNDIVRGGSGNDLITDLNGQNLLDGGMGSDVLTDGNGNSVLIGGKGNDVVKLGRGEDVLVFNRGDGRDTVIGGGESVANDTLVLGGGVRYEDLSFRRDGHDLVLTIGQDGCDPDQIRFEDWYLGNRTVNRLEIALDASGAYQAGSTNPLLNHRTESFDFAGLVSRFNTVSHETCGHGWLQYAPTWSLNAALMDFHLGGSDGAMTGGDLSHYYTHQGTLSGLSLGVAQATLGSADLGEQQQTVSPIGVQASGAVRL